MNTPTNTPRTPSTKPLIEAKNHLSGYTRFIGALLLAALTQTSCAKRGTLQDRIEEMMKSMPADGSPVQIHQVCNNDTEVIRKAYIDHCQHATSTQTYEKNGIPCIKCVTPISREELFKSMQ